jgi:hypothetical protein
VVEAHGQTTTVLAHILLSIHYQPPKQFPFDKISAIFFKKHGDEYNSENQEGK